MCGTSQLHISLQYVVTEPFLKLILQTMNMAENSLEKSL